MVWNVRKIVSVDTKEQRSQNQVIGSWADVAL